MMVRLYAMEICGDCEDCAGYQFDAEVGLWFRDANIPDYFIAAMLAEIAKPMPERAPNETAITINGNVVGTISDN